MVRTFATLEKNEIKVIELCFTASCGKQCVNKSNLLELVRSVIASQPLCVSFVANKKSSIIQCNTGLCKILLWQF